MTDRSGLFGDWRVVLAGAVAVLSAAVVTVVVRTGNPATADTYLSDVRNAAMTLRDGTSVEATDGLRVPDGATVRTGAAGAARLTTDGRDVYLGALSTLTVVNGVQESLDRGQAMADTRNGPKLALATRAGTVDVAEGSVARVELGPLVRVGVFRGSCRFRVPGRQATTTVPALYQLQAPYVGLPGTPTALALTDDAWEQRLAGELVTADRDLAALARGLAGQDGLVVLSAAPVALRSVPPLSPDRGEQALAVAVAQAADSGSSALDNLMAVQTARGQGGSWGVVAAIVRARVSAVSALLDSLLAPPGSSPHPVVAGPTAPFTSLFSPTPAPSTSGPSTRPPTRTPTSTPTRKRPHTSPTPSVVDQVITTVTGLLSPTPTPKPTPTHT